MNPGAATGARHLSARHSSSLRKPRGFKPNGTHFGATGARHLSAPQAPVSATVAVRRQVPSTGARHVPGTNGAVEINYLRSSSSGTGARHGARGAWNDRCL